MSERLLSVGLDEGPTSTQMILSELTVENQAGSFSVPQMEISRRKILYKSEVHFTPLLGIDLVDAAALREIIDREYRLAGIDRRQVDTGAIIITGETSRKENAQAVLGELSGFAGDFVVATAGPDLESVLAAKGAGADAYSAQTGRRVLHMDIGGGTSNLALIEEGRIIATGCLNVGGRLVKLRQSGEITYVSPVLNGLCDLRVGQILTQAQGEAIGEMLTRALEMAAGLWEVTPLLQRLTTPGTTPLPPADGAVISFSGGVADCIAQDAPWLKYGDLGVVLGQAIRRSRLWSGDHILGRETIRATVIGAGCHSAQLSGSTVFHRNVAFPLKNIPAVPFSPQLAGDLARQEGAAVIALPGFAAPGYAQVQALAGEIAAACPQGAVYVCLEQDMAKALGQALAARIAPERPILCIDHVRLTSGSYLDVGAPVGPALPVVVKTLVLSR